MAALPLLFQLSPFRAVLTWVAVGRLQQLLAGLGVGLAHLPDAMAVDACEANRTNPPVGPCTRGNQLLQFATRTATGCAAGQPTRPSPWGRTCRKNSV